MPEAPETRQTLILRLRNPGDAEAWRAFVDIYQPLVYRLARHLGMQHADALEATQEVMLHLADAVGKWQPDPSRGTFRGWLYRVARNVMLRFLEVRAKQPSASGDSNHFRAIQQTVDPACYESSVFDYEFRRQVFAWATRLVRNEFESNTWHAFWRTFVEQQPVESVAESLEMSRGAIYVARSRVMKRLRHVVQARLADDSFEPGT
jgi:RNA polymerase sigma-70 factor (ECF subfamily)